MISLTNERGQRMVNGVRQAREGLGLSMNEVSRRADIDRLTLRKIERNDGYAPAGSVMLRLAQALGARVQDLFWSEAAPA